MNLYSKVLDNQKILNLLNEDQKKVIKKFEMDEYKSHITFKDFYFQLVEDAKEEYPNSEFIQAIDCDYNIGHLSVVDMFEPLDMLEWENDCDDNYFKWNQCIYDVLDSETVENLKTDFKSYFDIVKDTEI